MFNAQHSKVPVSIDRRERVECMDGVEGNVQGAAARGGSCMYWEVDIRGGLGWFAGSGEMSS